MLFKIVSKHIVKGYFLLTRFVCGQVINEDNKTYLILWLENSPEKIIFELDSPKIASNILKNIYKALKKEN